MAKRLYANVQQSRSERDSQTPLSPRSQLARPCGAYFERASSGGALRRREGLPAVHAGTSMNPHALVLLAWW